MEMNDIEIRDWLHSVGVYDYDICDGVVHVVGNVNLNISNMGLTSIPVPFGYVSGYFSCSHNQLTSLEGCPSEVGGVFDCRGNQFASLEGCPSEVGGSFYCGANVIESEPDHSHIKIGGGFRWE